MVTSENTHSLQVRTMALATLMPVAEMGDSGDFLRNWLKVYKKLEGSRLKNKLHVT